ncbi:esterase [Salegentibacter salinarum]|uniref:Esterase n=1 Tax=Salegentibacter salinarum TaxID=447422 RepID=A0A2N0TPQ8_9FLAO|nr:esterase [Salegentibacter salinarum]PKD16698.1 esterase [Salegentibacter salinarum]SKB60563.1 Predicted esterase [Salegentibacter salinarum]
MSTEKQLSYQITNTYSVLNDFTERTQTVWLVCHGIGYLSRYFLRHFHHLNSEENYIIAPQAQSKYYLNNEYKHVGASWLTKERTEAETENVLNYLDEVYKTENLKNAPRLIVLGYSQGVSVATRWISRRKIECDELIMHSGKVPAELKPEDFKFLKNTNFTFIYGTEDAYLKDGIIKVEEKRLKEIFPTNFKIKTYKGGHEVNTKLIAEFA